MQINIAQPGPPSMVELSIFAPPSAELNQAQQQHHQQAYQQLMVYGQAGMDYFNQVTQAQQAYYQQSGMAVAQTLVNLGGVVQGSMEFYLHPIETLDDLRLAPVDYQPYLMANPVVRQLYLDGRVEGYVDTYDNACGNDIGIHHRDYRDVITNSGNWMYEDADEKGYYFRECIGNVMEERQPKLREKVNVFTAWLIQNAAIEQGQDPTSIDGFNIQPEQTTD